MVRLPERKSATQDSDKADWKRLSRETNLLSSTADMVGSEGNPDTGERAQKLLEASPKTEGNTLSLEALDNPEAVG